MVADIISQFLNRLTSTLFEPIMIVGCLEDARLQINMTTVDLLLVDVYLPDGQGTDFLSELRKNHNAVATVMITAADDRETIRQAMTNGVVDYLIKPFQMKRFNQAIQKFLMLEEIALGKEKLSQQDINEYFQGESRLERLDMRLPKGISDATLKLIITTIYTFSEAFSNRMLSQSVALSRVTTKKYLDYLVENDLLKVKITYLEVGRPLTQYTINNLKSDKLHHLTS